MDNDALSPLRDSVRSARNRFLEAIEPLRPDLFRYARGLTPSVWDAEDLVQEALARAFSNLGRFDEVRNPKAYLFRIATNAWLDQNARRRPQPMPEEYDAADEAEWVPLPEVRDALEALARSLPPRERAAVLLFDVFGFSLAETAQALTTTVGAVKAALSRGRKSLREEPPAEPRPDLPTAVVDEFVDAFNAHDIERLLALLTPEATTEVVGVAAGTGVGMAKSVLANTLSDKSFERAEAVAYGGETVVLLWHAGGALGEVLRLEHAGGVVTRYRAYYFTPEVLAAVAGDLGVESRGHGRTVTAG